MLRYSSTGKVLILGGRITKYDKIRTWKLKNKIYGNMEICELRGFFVLGFHRSKKIYGNIEIFQPKILQY